MKNKNTETPLFFSQTLNYLKTYLPKQMGSSPATIQSYTDSLTSFRRYLLNERGLSIAKFTFSQCTRELVLGYIDFMRETGSSAASCNVRLSAIKNYISYAADNDISLQGISFAISKIKAMRVPKREKKLLSEDALAALLAKPDNTKIGLRNKTIMILLYDSAIRLSELINLDVSDVDCEGLSVHVEHGKGNKERTVSITSITASHLKNYMSVFHAGESTPDTYLFIP